MRTDEVPGPEPAKGRTQQPGRVAARPSSRGRDRRIETLVLRPATEADAAAVATVHLASRAAAAMPPSVHDDDDVRRWLAGRLREDGDAEAWVADQGGLVVGYARLTGTWLDDLYVLPEHARQGVGSALLEVVKARRPDGFCLWVFEVNEPARRFYARHGLVELERADGTANEERAPDIRMVWPGADPLRFLRGLIDEVDEEGGATARSQADAPEIDGNVLLRDAGGLKPGDIVPALIEDADEHDLFGVPAARP